MEPATKILHAKVLAKACATTTETILVSLMNDVDLAAADKCRKVEAAYARLDKTEADLKKVWPEVVMRRLLHPKILAESSSAIISRGQT